MTSTGILNASNVRTFDPETSYENRLNRDLEWALMQGGKHFSEESDVHKALRKIARRLDELQIPYALVGGLALFHHGLRRFTEDVDLLVTSDSLRAIHSQLEGLGYLPPHPHSKHLRDTEFGVRIEFLVSGQFPGDGKPKPVAFPDPEGVAVEIKSIKCISLPALVELKLASGMTAPHRGRDLFDVTDLIDTLNLKEEFADSLNPFVREKYLEIWRSIPRKFILRIDRPAPFSDRSFAEYLNSFGGAIPPELQALLDDGVRVDENASTTDYFVLVTTDEGVANRRGMFREAHY